MFKKSWFIWLILIVIWNFGWPNAKPIWDVIIAVLLSIGVYLYNQQKSK